MIVLITHTHTYSRYSIVVGNPGRVIKRPVPVIPMFNPNPALTMDADVFDFNI
jgi:hypothetical protein